MIYPNSVNNSLYTLLSSDSVLISSNVTVELNTLYNLDPNRTPWVGIYNNDIIIEPHRVQKPNPWMTTYQPLIYVQDIRYDDEQIVNDRTNDLLTAVLSAINSESNRNLGGSVDIVKGFQISPFELDIEDDTSIYAYEIIMTADKRA